MVSRIPSQSEYDEMNRIFSPLFEKVILNNQHITKLITIRDTLLPKLMNGDVRVKLGQGE